MLMPPMLGKNFSNGSTKGRGLLIIGGKLTDELSNASEIFMDWPKLLVSEGE